MMAFLKKLIWIDWLFIVVTVLLLAPIFAYAYGTLIVGDLGFSSEQKRIVVTMSFIWLGVMFVYVPSRHAITTDY